MKNVVTIILFITLFKSNAQDNSASVEKSIFNIETGFLGVWINNESKLSNSIALRTELGLDSGLFWKQDTKTGFLLAPSIRVEPRWYYNLDKRNDKGRSVKNNSANFITPSITYIPDWFVVSNYDNLNIPKQISIIPKWGIRRNVKNSNFNYEINLGLGYRMIFYETKTDKGAVLDLGARIGYSF
jgi:hypothetical protein